MENSEIIKKYVTLVDFISEVLGDHCEVVLHDLSKPESSVIAIKNGHLSGREVGGPLTDLVLRVIKNANFNGQNFVTNYKALSSKKSFRSSSFFIKNDLEEIIGVLCINIDIEPYIKVKEVMESLSFINTPENKGINCTSDKDCEIIEEKFFSNIEDMLSSMLQEEISAIGVPVQRMSVEEKVQVVKKLNYKGVFHLKGAVSQVAKALDVSEPTAYRYINLLKQ